MNVEPRHDEIIQELNQEFDRLKRINHLGWVAEVFPGARHSKWEHAIGTYHVAKIAFQSLRLSGVNRDHFLAAALVHSIGHLPYTYATAEGVVLAARQNATVAEEIRGMASVVNSSFQGARPVPTDWSSAGTSSKDLSRLLSSYVVAQKMAAKNSGKLVWDVVRNLFDSASLGYQVLAFADELDYVVRDLYHSGIATLTLNYDSMLGGVRIEDRDGRETLEYDHLPEYSIVESSRNLLMQKLFADSRVLAVEGYFSKLVAKALVEGKLRVEALLRADDSELRSELQAMYRETTKLRQALEGHVKSIFSVASFVDSATDTEWDLTEKIVSDRINYPFESGFLIVVKAWSPEVPNCFLLVADDAKALKPIVALGSRMEGYPGEWVGIKHMFGPDLMRLLFSRFPRVESRGRAIETLKRVIVEDLEKWTKAFVENFDASKANSRDIYFIPETELRHEVPANAPWSLKFAASKRADPAAAAGHLVSLIMESPGLLKPALYHQIAAVLHEAEKSNMDGRLTEAKTLLLELEEAAGHQVQWVVHNVECYNAEGKVEREIDVVTTWLDDEKVHVRLAECTLRDREHKAAQDAAKLVEVRKELEQRFNDLEVKPCVYGKDPGVEFRTAVFPTQLKPAEAPPKG